MEIIKEVKIYLPILLKNTHLVKILEIYKSPHTTNVPPTAIGDTFALK